MLCAFFAASNRSLIDLFDRLPARFSKAALLKDFPKATSVKVFAQLTPNSTGRCFNARIDRTDRERMLFSGDDVAHARPSGNAGRFNC